MKEERNIEGMLLRSEKAIETAAKKFIGQGCGYEMMLREGRRLVWKTISINYIVEDTFEAFSNLIRNDLEAGLERFVKITKRRRAPLAWFFEIFPEDFEFEVKREKLDELRKIAIRTGDDKAVQAVIYYLVAIMGVKKEDVPNFVNYESFVKFGLQRFLWIFFSNSPYRAIMKAYPNLRPEDMKRRPIRYWQQADSKEKAVKDLQNLLSSSDYSEESIPLIVNDKFLVDHRLRTPLNKFFNGSPFSFLDAAFPEKYMPWQMSVTPMKCFDEEYQVIKATKWLVEKVLGFDVSNMSKREIWKNDIAKKITKEKFEENGLRGLLNRYDNSPKKILRLAYPKKFQDWSFPNNDKWSRGEESLKLAAKATRWVIEKYACVEPSSKIGYKFFIDNGLRGMITSKKLGFNSSPKAALLNAYPEMEFK